MHSFDLCPHYATYKIGFQWLTFCNKWYNNIWNSVYLTQLIYKKEKNRIRYQSVASALIFLEKKYFHKKIRMIAQIESRW